MYIESNEAQPIRAKYNGVIMGVEGPFKESEKTIKKRSSLMLLEENMANDVLATHMASASLCRIEKNSYKGLDITYKLEGEEEVRCKFFALDEGKMIVSEAEGLLSVVEVSKLEEFSCIYLQEALSFN
jgi:hypothetical protein